MKTVAGKLFLCWAYFLPALYEVWRVWILQLGFFVDGGFYLIYLAPSFPNLGLAFIGLVRVFSPTVLSIVQRLETSIFNKLVINKLEKKKKKRQTIMGVCI